MSSTTQALRMPARYRLLPVLVITGFAVAVIDIVYAFLFYAQYGATPKAILQSVASGLLGRAAFSDGNRSAALGLFLHFFIAYSITAFYLFLSRKVTWINRHFVLCGLSYGAGIFLFMHVVVIPLSAHSHRAMPTMAALCEFTEHMLLVGLPIALAARCVTSDPQSMGR